MNKEQKLIYMRDYYKKYPEKYKIYQKSWRENNPEKWEKYLVWKKRWQQDWVKNHGGRKDNLKNWAMLKRIIEENNLKKYQILCYNCNMGRARNKGICPHKNR